MCKYVYLPMWQKVWGLTLPLSNTQLFRVKQLDNGANHCETCAGEFNFQNLNSLLFYIRAYGA